MNAEQLKFLTAIGYPLDELEGTEGNISLLVDGFTVELCPVRGGLVLRYKLETRSETDVARIMGYAAGRMMKEEAVVAYDPERKETFLWQKVPAGANEESAKLAFELFMTSCEWWKSAVGAEISRSTEQTADEFVRITP